MNVPTASGLKSRRHHRRLGIAAFATMLLGGCAEETGSTAPSLLGSCRADVAHDWECGEIELPEEELPALAEAECDYLEKSLADQDPACEAALASVKTCHASRPCDAPEVAPECWDARLEAADVCPAFFGICGGMIMRGRGPNACSFDWSVCADGHDYKLECDNGTCTCLRNDSVDGSFQTEDCHLLVEDLEPRISTSCGWPALVGTDDY
jgi:hypothetical protein